jgi:hypothetical protein
LVWVARSAAGRAAWAWLTATMAPLPFSMLPGCWGCAQGCGGFHWHMMHAVRLSVPPNPCRQCGRPPGRCASPSTGASRASRAGKKVSVMGHSLCGGSQVLACL